MEISQKFSSPLQPEFKLHTLEVESGEHFPDTLPFKNMHKSPNEMKNRAGL